MLAPWSTFDKQALTLKKCTQAATQRAGTATHLDVAFLQSWHVGQQEVGIVILQGFDWQGNGACWRGQALPLAGPHCRVIVSDLPFGQLLTAGRGMQSEQMCSGTCRDSYKAALRLQVVVRGTT